MKSQTLILLIVAAGCGLVAMLGVQQVLNNKGEDETEKVQVLQASVDIGMGQTLNEVNTQFVTVDVNTVPDGAVTDLEQITNRAVLIPVNIGDWITEKKLGPPGSSGVTIRIPDGMQVATIPVDPTTSHSGMLQPGHRVDLMINYEDKNETGERIQKVRRILQYVEVFAVDNKVYGLNDDGQPGKAKNISLLVTPDQALFLELAKTKGRMSTVLRRNGDDVELAADELSADELEGKLPNVNLASALDTKQVPETDDEQESADSMLQELQEEFLGFETGPTAEIPDEIEDETWQIAIWEGTTVRVDTVNLRSDMPIPTTTDEPAPAMSAPAGIQVPVPPDAPANGGQDGLEGLLEGLKDAPPDLWSLFGE